MDVNNNLKGARIIIPAKSVDNLLSVRTMGQFRIILTQEIASHAIQQQKRNEFLPFQYVNISNIY